MDAWCWEVEPERIYGRPGPNAEPWDLAALRSRGLSAVVSLAALPGQERDLMDRLRIPHYAAEFPLDRFSQPYGIANPANDFLLDVWERVDDALARHVFAGGWVLVHCEMGRDRTGLIAAYCLMTRQGHSAQGAIDEVRQRKTDALSAPGFKLVLRAYEAVAVARRAIGSPPATSPRPVVCPAVWCMDGGPGSPSVSIPFAEVHQILRAAWGAGWLTLHAGGWLDPLRDGYVAREGVPALVERVRRVARDREAAHRRAVAGRVGRGRLDAWAEEWLRQAQSGDRTLAALRDLVALSELAAEADCGLQVRGSRVGV